MVSCYSNRNSSILGFTSDNLLESYSLLSAQKYIWSKPDYYTMDENVDDKNIKKTKFSSM